MNNSGQDRAPATGRTPSHDATAGTGPQAGARPRRSTGRTRWRRLALALVPTLAVSGGLVVSMAQGALAASFGVSANSFIVSASSFQIAADTLMGDGFEQFGSVDQGKHDAYPVALTGIRSAELVNLCQSVVQNVPVIGPVTLHLTAGDDGRNVHADRLLSSAEEQKGDAVFTNIQIGRDASTVDAVPGVSGADGGFAQQADTIRIDHLQQRTRSSSAATFRLPNLDLKVMRGDHSCF